MNTVILPAMKRYAELNFRDFATRLCSYNEQKRKDLTRASRRKAKEERFKARALRGFFPQRGMKVERADTTPEMKAKGWLYCTMSNGMVVNVARAKKWVNPVVLRAVDRHVTEMERAEA